MKKELNDIIKQFLTKTIPDMNSMEYDMPYIKFVFKDKDLEEMNKFFKENLDVDELEKIKKSLSYLKDIKNEILKTDDDIFINIDNYQEFFELLSNIVITYAVREEKRLLHSINFIRSIWLRMSPSDINDVNSFLKRQLQFLKYDNVLNYYKTFYKKCGEFDILYENKSNDDWFETNNHIDFSLRRNVAVESNDLLSLSDRDEHYDFPSIHYAFNQEDGKPVCYIYGIQNIGNMRKDEVIQGKIKFEKKYLRNKYVSPDFILSLKIFIDFLRDNNIRDIKVPLLQVFNYTYHKHLSNDVKQAYFDYTDLEKNTLENLYNNGDRSDKVLDYIHNKKMYDKFVGKEDMISKNKTERLINTFLIMKEKYNNIDFLTEPFMESDYLLIKINKELEKEKPKKI